MCRYTIRDVEAVMDVGLSSRTNIVKYFRWLSIQDVVQTLQPHQHREGDAEQQNADMAFALPI